MLLPAVAVGGALMFTTLAMDIVEARDRVRVRRKDLSTNIAERYFRLDEYGVRWFEGKREQSE
jgi:hypothetical protein